MTFGHLPIVFFGLFSSIFKCSVPFKQYSHFVSDVRYFPPNYHLSFDFAYGVLNYAIIFNLYVSNYVSVLIFFMIVRRSSLSPSLEEFTHISFQCPCSFIFICRSLIHVELFLCLG